MTKKIWGGLTILLLVGMAFGTSYADVVINEVFYDPSGNDTGEEWIELYNNGSSAISLDGYCLYASGEHYVFDSFTLDAGAYVVIHWNAEGSDSSADLYTGTTDWSNMGNGSGSVALWNTHDSHTQDTIVDFMEYGDSDNSYDGEGEDAGIWTADDYAPGIVESGRSLEYKGSGDTGSDWFDQPVPTPGADNSLPVELSSFTAKLTPNGVLLKWKTESEIENAGFNLYRSEDGELVKVNANLIEGAGTTANPQEYRYVDEEFEDGSTLFYVVESVAFDGKTSRSDPVKVTLLLKPKKKIASLWGRLRAAD